MNIKLFIKTCLATTLMALAVTSAKAQVQAQLVARPLTPGEIANATYALPANLEPSGGLLNVGVGQPVYLEIDVATNVSVPNVTNITWVLAQRPVGSAALLQASPLGTNVPVYEPADRLVYQAADRMLLRPDVAGYTTNDLYVVTATVRTSNQGSTNLTLTVTAATYMGVGLLPGTTGCALCHSGGQVATNMVAPWELTAHSTMFANGINGVLSSHYSASCIQCHTVGYDTNALAVNGGFDDVAKALGWTFPTVLTNSNWSNMEANYPTLANLANIQCENCHGPGSQHMDTFGKTNMIAISFGSGVCAQCHDDPPGHIHVAEWQNSKHAVTTTDPAGNATCVGCHTAYGFVGRIEGWTTTNTAYMAINCQTCHEPHGATLPGTNAPNQYIIRTLASVTLMDGTVVTNGGEGLLCMQCHHARQNASTYASTTKGSAYFGPHEGPQADMLEGVNGFTYGLAIPSSAHASAVTNTCVACHMQTIASSDPAYLHAGGHTFENSYNGEDLIAACQQCHGSITSFDFPVEDFSGSGTVQGVQTQIQSLLNELSTLLPPVGTVKSSLSISSSWTQPQLEAAYNWLFVNNDGSLGVHNTAYASGLLKASIANLTGVSVPGGLPDAWVIEYFGTVNNPAGAPNAINNTNGVPNWMMYALGLDPTQSGITVPGGVVWMDGKNLINSGATNTVQIYTAAEVSFNTVSGTTYQIQGISSLSGGWQNIGNPISGTGEPVSYLTSTRNNPQMFFRVLHNP
ncbi:MAG TPA: hypothetical protein VMA35_04600 [Candidatus Sulfopaludibacter sp.]|nr:hypothetical protein [Candidatus Sulfopaludibacter sp.]